MTQLLGSHGNVSIMRGTTARLEDEGQYLQDVMPVLRWRTTETCGGSIAACPMARSSSPSSARRRTAAAATSPRPSRPRGPAPAPTRCRSRCPSPGAHTPSTCSAASNDFVARLRPDLWFFGAPPPLAAIFPPSAPRGVAFAAGVVGSFRRAEAANDHVAWASRDAAPEYFRLVDALAAGDDFREMLDYGGTWLLWRMRNRSVPVAAPTPIAPYTVARACDGAAPGLAVAVECYRWRVDEARRTASPPLALADLRAAYDACVSRWDEERAARPASTCAAIDDAPAYNTWSFPARGDAAA